MPIYAFECTRCGHRFERLQRLSDIDPATCPACGVEGEVRRQLTAPSFRLAGGGWYETDFKKEGKRNLADKGDAPSPSGGSDSGAAKPDAKPATAASDSKPAPAAPTPAPAGKPAAPKSDG
jgi:putative FmdB family regulatory protein